MDISKADGDEHCYCMYLVFDIMWMFIWHVPRTKLKSVFYDESFFAPMPNKHLPNVEQKKKQDDDQKLPWKDINNN